MIIFGSPRSAIIRQFNSDRAQSFALYVSCPGIKAIFFVNFSVTISKQLYLSGVDKGKARIKSIVTV